MNKHKIYDSTTGFYLLPLAIPNRIFYRDAKQYTGLNHCQGRSKQKLDFHWNAALTTVNLAMVLHQCDESPDKGNFSMANFKTRCHNTLLLERLIDVCGINPNSAVNQKNVKELLLLGNRAA